MYVITEWLERYEVNEKGQPARLGDKLRVKPLEYIRSKVHGRAEGAGFMKMVRIAHGRHMEVFGAFQKFLEIAGAEERHKRGFLLNEKGEAATIQDLALFLRTTEKKIAFILQVLMDKRVAWIQELPFQKFQEFQEKSGGLYNETKRNDNDNDNRTERNAPGKPGASVDSARALSSSDRLGFGLELRKILNAKNNGDLQALTNLEHWLATQAPERYGQVLAIAKESRSGRKPIAVFFSRLDKEVGYRPRILKEKYT